MTEQTEGPRDTDRPLASLVGELEQITGQSFSDDPRVVALTDSEQSKVSVPIAWCYWHDGQWRFIHDRHHADGSRHVPAVRSPRLRQAAVPTKLSGAEFSSLGGATDTRRKAKHALTGREIGPATVILDPAATCHTPEWLWLSTGIRALDHAVESLTSVAPVPLVDGCALYALELLSAGYHAHAQTQTIWRPGKQCMHGAWLASQGILGAPYGASQRIGHNLGASTGVSHGYTSCVLLPAVLRWNHDNAHGAARQDRIAAALGRNEGDAAEAVAKLIKALGLPSRAAGSGDSQSPAPRHCRRRYGQPLGAYQPTCDQEHGGHHGNP